MKKSHKKHSSKSAKPVSQASGDPCLKNKRKRLKPLHRGDVVVHRGSTVAKKGSIWVVEGNEPAPFESLYNIRSINGDGALRAWRCRIRKVEYNWPAPYSAETWIRMMVASSKISLNRFLRGPADWQLDTLRRLEIAEELEGGASLWQLKLRRRLGRAGVKWEA